jgi:glycerate-2-kinase
MGMIKNFKELAATAARRSVLEITEAGLAAINMNAVFAANVRVAGDQLIVADERFTLRATGRLLVVAVGKCALGAGAALERILGDRLTGGIALDIRDGKLAKLETYAGTHPVATAKNVAATARIIELLTGLAEDDFVIFVISGGSSALLCQPGNLTIEDEGAAFTCLTIGGATIQELNTLRKHLSLARGGHLAKYAYPARSVALIISDIPGNDLEFVASGPTVRDTTTVADAAAVLRKYDAGGRCAAVAAGLIETPKDEKYFARVANMLLLSNETALRAMAARAGDLGYAARIVTTTLSGEARDVATKIVAELHGAPPGSVLLYGGETTVTVRGKGKGGRNLELALAVLRTIGEGEVLAAVASDGRDNTDAAGTLCDTMAKERALGLGLDPEAYLAENRSYDFWEQVGTCLVTGDTGSNVSDLIIALHE